MNSRPVLRILDSAVDMLCERGGAEPEGDVAADGASVGS